MNTSKINWWRYDKDRAITTDFIQSLEYGEYIIHTYSTYEQCVGVDKTTGQTLMETTTKCHIRFMQIHSAMSGKIATIDGHFANDYKHEKITKISKLIF